jgi:hypothetical protein
MDSLETGADVYLISALRLRELLTGFAPCYAAAEHMKKHER